MPDKLMKSVIGSHPISFDTMGLVAIREAVNDQTGAGVDLISDGQTRTDMITYFARTIDGMKPGKEKARIVERIKEVSPGVILGDLKVAKALVEGGPQEVKGIVTGPVTLAFSSEIQTDAYTGYRDRNLYMDLASALIDIALILEKAGAAWIQIDEPYFSIGAPMEIAKEAIELMASEIKVPAALHVCGDVTKVFDAILEFEGVALLSHAFAGYPQNLELLDREKIESSGKRVGLGCVNTVNTEVETPGAVTDLIIGAADRIGLENIVVHPDCGMKTLPRDVAKAKLEIMCKGADAAVE